MIYNTDYLDIYFDIKEYFTFNGINVLNNENNQSMVHFINLIKNNI